MIKNNCKMNLYVRNFNHIDGALERFVKGPPMPHVHRSSSRSRAPRRSPPRSGTPLEVCAICPPSVQGPLGGPRLRPVGTAVVNPDGTITAWLAAHPHSGALLLRPLQGAPLAIHASDAASPEGRPPADPPSAEPPPVPLASHSANFLH